MSLLQKCVAVLLLLPSGGCSILGFPTNPAAHTLSEQSRQVLEASPRVATTDLPRELAQHVLPAHYLEPGDELLFEIDDLDSSLRIPPDQRVAADGTVDLGRHGRVIVASLSLEEAEERVHERVSEGGDRDLSVNIRLVDSVQRYYVIGEVNSPGSYPLTGNENVLDGILAAGGLTLRASACDMMLARPTDPCTCRVALPVCYRAITQLGDTSTNYQLRPGDRIFVGRQTIWEELLQCCRGAKTCERCCRLQNACPNPWVAETNRPSFADAHDQMPTDVDTWADVEVHELPEELPSGESERGPSSAPAPLGLDGELDFGGLSQ